MNKTLISDVDLPDISVKMLFNQISTVTITGATSVSQENSLKGSLYGSDIIAASSFYIGKKWYADISGTYSTPPISVGTATIKIYLGTVPILSYTVSNLPINVSTLPYTGHIEITCRNTGSNGTIAATGWIQFNTGTSLTSLNLQFIPTVTPIDLTTDKIYNSTIQYSLTGNTNTTMMHSLISLN